LSYTVRVERAAEKALTKRIQPEDADRIREAIVGLAEDPRPATASRKLRGREGYRLRVGDYRVIYDIDDEEEIVSVLDVGHRQGIY
jgi:mRNA interferase RelE/StbE